MCLYAGSIVPKELLQYCPPGARIIDTAPMSLDEIEAEFIAARDKNRLDDHTGNIGFRVAQSV